MLLEPMLHRLRKTRCLEHSLHVALSDVVALLGGERGSIRLFDPEGQLVIVHQMGLSRAFVRSFGCLRPGDASVCARAATRREIVCVPDVEDAPEFPPLRVIARTMPFRSVVSAPLLGPQGCVGSIAAHFANRFQPSEMERETLQDYCGHLAATILGWQPETALQQVSATLATALLREAAPLRHG